MELASCHLSGASNLKVVSIFLRNMLTTAPVARKRLPF